MIPRVIVLLPLTWGYLPPLPPFSESNHRRDNECMRKGMAGWMMMVLGKLGPGQLGLGQLGPGRLGPGARLSRAQLSTLKKWQIGPRTVGPQICTIPKIKKIIKKTKHIILNVNKGVPKYQIHK